MNKKLGIKVLLKNPLAVIMDGIRAQEQKYFRIKCISEYGIEQLRTIDFLDLFPDFNEHISTYSFLDGTSLITDLVLLKLLAKRFDSCSHMEIGSWRGESIVNVHDVTKDCTSVTLSQKEMRSLNYGDEFIKVHGVFSDPIRTITKVESNSRTYDFGELNKTFDLIFVDGDHSYEGVLNDSQKVFALRKNKQSVIVWHDYGFNTEDVRHSTLKGILDGIPKEFHKNLYHISNTICAVYIEDINIPAYHTCYPSYPNKKFILNVAAQKLKTIDS